MILLSKELGIPQLIKTCAGRTRGFCEAFGLETQSLRAVPIIRTSERLDMSISNVCAQDTSTSIEDIVLDWADYSELLLHQIETEIFENNDPKQFNAEYVKLCDARMRAKFQLNSIPPDDRWIRKFCRDQ